MDPRNRRDRDSHGYVFRPTGPLPGFPEAVRVRPKVGGSGRARASWQLPNGVFLEWDYQHGTVEAYNHRGEHLGEFDPDDGRQLKRPNPKRRADP